MTVFWPGIHPHILRTSGSCMTCVREESSQPAGFPVAPPSSKYPFQMIVADYFSIHGHNFLVIADRFTGWNAIISLTPGKFDGQNLVTILRDFSRSGSIDNKKLIKSVLQYRNTPNHCRRSPAQMVFGRTLRDHIL
jgi:hypothetical protein